MFKNDRESPDAESFCPPAADGHGGDSPLARDRSVGPAVSILNNGGENPDADSYPPAATDGENPGADSSLAVIDDESDHEGESPPLACDHSTAAVTVIPILDGENPGADTSCSPAAVDGNPGADSSQAVIDDDATSEKQATLPVVKEYDDGEARLRLNLAGVTRIHLFVARVRLRVQQGHERLALRIGVSLYLVTLAHIVSIAHRIIISGASSNDASLLTYISNSLSVVALLLHLGCTLSHGKTKLLRAHFSTHATGAVIAGASNLMRGDTYTALYHLVFWAFFFYPFIGYASLKFFNRLHITNGIRDEASAAAVSTFICVSTPILYFTLNSYLCLAYKESLAIDVCSTRVIMNSATVIALGFNGLGVIFLTIRPVTLIQIMHISLPRGQLVAFGSSIALLLLVTALHSQNERFAPATANFVFMYRLTYPCVLISLIGFGYDLAAGRQQGTLPTSSTIRSTADAEVSPKSAMGSLIMHRMHPLHRGVMCSLSALYLAASSMPIFSTPFAPLSFTAAVFHIPIAILDNSWVAVLNFIAHGSSVVIIVCRAPRSTTPWIFAIGHGCIMYPGLLKGLLALRRTVRAHGKDAAVGCASQCFVAFYVLQPPLLYFCSDSLGTRRRDNTNPCCCLYLTSCCPRAPVGCMLQRPSAWRWQEYECGSRISANYVGALHLVALSLVSMAAADDKWGGGLTQRAIMLLDITWRERVAGLLIAASTFICVYLFASRETKGSRDLANATHSRLESLFVLCWGAVGITLIPKLSTMRSYREQQTASGRALSETSAAERVPHAWGVLFALASSSSFLVPQICRCIFHLEWLRGCTGTFSNLCLLAHWLMTTVRECRTTWWLQRIHWCLHVLGAVWLSVADGVQLEPNNSVAAFVASCSINLLALVVEYWLWFEALRPMLKRRVLHKHIPETIFSWLFRRGGVVYATYLYFESVGAGFQNLSLRDVAPWMHANNTVLTQFSLTSILALTIVADTGVSVSVVMRGRAPRHILVGFVLSGCTSFIALFVFAGRELASSRQTVIYVALWNVFLFLWAVTVFVMTAGHLKWFAPSPTRRRVSQRTFTAGAPRRRPPPNDADAGNHHRQPNSRKQSYLGATSGEAVLKFAV